jgi:hypothetical protein
MVSSLILDWLHGVVADARLGPVSLDCGCEQRGGVAWSKGATGWRFGHGAEQQGVLLLLQDPKLAARGPNRRGSSTVSFSEQGSTGWAQRWQTAPRHVTLLADARPVRVRLGEGPWQRGVRVARQFHEAPDLSLEISAPPPPGAGWMSSKGCALRARPGTPR